MEQHVASKFKGEGCIEEVQAYSAGDNVSKATALPDVVVVRGEDWKWGDEDGGSGNPGRILSVEGNGRITVHWQATGIVESHYRFGTRGRQDLALAHGFADATQSFMMATFQRWSQQGNARNSQTQFAEKAQTVIILDWDDTLFPSTFVRSDMQLDLTRALKDQRLPPTTKKQIANSLTECAAACERLLRLASSYGKVILVTLARSPWVQDSCKQFYPRIGELLKKLDVTVVYAQERANVKGAQVPKMSPKQVESFWSAVKGKAIAQEVKKFYNKYEGQSWKNIISIGDSNFERLGTMKAAAEYMREKGVEVPASLEETLRKGLIDSPETQGAGFKSDETTPVVVAGHTFQVRTKVLKMIDEPTVQELAVELGLVQQWLPLMVRHDGGFTVDLAGLEDWNQARAIESQLARKAMQVQPKAFESEANVSENQSSRV
jgi:hypothetical protein